MLIETRDQDDLPKRDDPAFLEMGLPKPGYLRDIALADLINTQRAPQHVGKGWSAVFSADGNSFFLADFNAARIGKTDTGKIRELYSIARHER